MKKSTKTIAKTKTIVTEETPKPEFKLSLTTPIIEYTEAAQHRDHANFALMQHQYHSAMAALKECSSKIGSINLTHKTEFLGKQIREFVNSNSEAGILELELRQAVDKVAMINGHVLSNWRILGDDSTYAAICSFCQKSVQFTPNYRISGELLIMKCTILRAIV